jgi:hypothetical protein
MTDKLPCACCGKPTHPDELLDRVCCYCIENMRIPARKEVPPIGTTVDTIDPYTS